MPDAEQDRLRGVVKWAESAEAPTLDDLFLVEVARRILALERKLDEAAISEESA